MSRDPRVDPEAGDIVEVPDRTTTQRWRLYVDAVRDGAVSYSTERFSYDVPLDLWRQHCRPGTTVIHPATDGAPR